MPRRFPRADGHPELCCLRWHRGPEPERAGSLDGRAGVAGLALVLHAGDIDGGDPEGVVPAIFAAGFLVTQEFQLARGYSPVSAGVRLLPFFATPMFISPIAGAV